MSNIRIGNQSKFSLLLGVILLLLSSCSETSDLELPARIEFNRHIRPILSDKCFSCHGPDRAARKGDLRLDIREKATASRPGYDRPAIIPGSPTRSELIARVTEDDRSKRMPPQQMDEAGSGGEALTAREIALLRRWIEAGAEWQEHWAYSKLKRPGVPGSDKTKNPIDRFLDHRFRKEKLQPVGKAAPHTLIRRLSLDVTGLPPDSSDVRHFLEDPGRYREFVDRYLDSDHFGERMALWWLDLVRYADTNGFHSDVHRRIWPYRDYVIHAFNQDKPFDQFTREQIAGDLLPQASREQRVASGFNRLGQVTKEGGAQTKEYLAIYAADRVRAIGTIWLGSTVACAECHDHKFDPFTTEDFYRLSAFFGDVKEKGVFGNHADVPPEMILTSQHATEAERERARIEKQRDYVNQLRMAKTESEKEQKALAEKLEKEEGQLARLLEETPASLVTVSVEPRVMRILPRGDWQSDSGAIVQPGIPRFLERPQLNIGSDRLALADWLVSPRNPLTARVLVNRIWAEFFGEGLSPSLDDFGSQGDPPSHPELLDWLAVELVENDWRLKPLIRLILESEAYQRSSRPASQLKQVDPDNRLFARQNRFRIRAEQVRDLILSVSGLLNRKIGGPSIHPYQPEDYWKEINTFGVEGPGSEWTDSTGSLQYRRGLYTYWKRTFLHPSMMAFDAPSRQDCTAVRADSNTPLQALTLLNDPSYVEAARVWAREVAGRETDFEERVQFLFLRALSRNAEPAEVEKLQELYKDQLRRYLEDAEAAQSLLRVGQFEFPSEEDPGELAAWTAVTRAVLNLHELITRY